MANSDKNIVITPNIGQTAEPKLVFTGSGNTPITMRVLDSNALSFEGSVGQLFSITNSLTGTLFSVNDISGIPSIEVLDTGLVKLNQYNGQSVIGSSAAATSSSIAAMLSVFSRTTTTPGVIVKAIATQTANLQEWQNSSGGIMSRVASDGYIYAGVFNASSNFYAGYQIIGGTQPYNFGGSAAMGMANWNSTFLTLGLRNTANQTGDTVQIQSSAGTVLGGRNSNAQVYTGSTLPITSTTGGATTTTSGTGTVATITTTSNHNLAVGDLVTVAGVTPTGYNGRFVVTAVTSTTLSYANATTGSQTVAGTVSVDSQLSITSRSAATPTLFMRMASAQTAAPFEIQTSAGVTVSRINSSGQFLISTLNSAADSLTNILLSTNRNIQLAGNTASHGGGSAVIGISNATTIPTSNPTGGGILYVDNGYLEFRDPLGGITPLSFPPVASQTTWTGAVSLTQAETMGNYIKKQLTGNTTVTVAAGISGQTYSCTLELQQDATGSRTIILSGVKTSFGVAFTLSTAANAIDIIRLEWNGASWTAFMAAQATAVPSGW